MGNVFEFAAESTESGIVRLHAIKMAWDQGRPECPKLSVSSGSTKNSYVKLLEEFDGLHTSVSRMFGQVIASLEKADKAFKLTDASLAEALYYEALQKADSELLDIRAGSTKQPAKMEDAETKEETEDPVETVLGILKNIAKGIDKKDKKNVSRFHQGAGVVSGIFDLASGFYSLEKEKNTGLEGAKDVLKIGKSETKIFNSLFDFLKANKNKKTVSKYSEINDYGNFWNGWGNVNSGVLIIGGLFSIGSDTLDFLNYAGGENKDDGKALDALTDGFQSIAEFGSDILKVKFPKTEITSQVEGGLFGLKYNLTDSDIPGNDKFHKVLDTDLKLFNVITDTIKSGGKGYLKLRDQDKTTGQKIWGTVIYGSTGGVTSVVKEFIKLGTDHVPFIGPALSEGVDKIIPDSTGAYAEDLMKNAEKNIQQDTVARNILTNKVEVHNPIDAALWLSDQAAKIEVSMYESVKTVSETSKQKVESAVNSILDTAIENAKKIPPAASNPVVDAIIPEGMLWKRRNISLTPGSEPQIHIPYRYNKINVPDPQDRIPRRYTNSNPQIVVPSRYVDSKIVTPVDTAPDLNSVYTPSGRTEQIVDMYTKGQLNNNQGSAAQNQN